MSSGTSTSDQIVNLAAKGMMQVQIARMLGVDESYVSQVVNSEDGQKAIQEQAVQITEANDKFDKQIEDLEQTALDRVKLRLNQANFQQSLAALKVLNALNKRRDTTPAARVTQGNVVPVVLPQSIAIQFTMNAQSQIVEVEGRTMVSASAGQLAHIAQKKLGRDPTVVVEAAQPAKIERAVEMLTSLEYQPRKRSKSIAELDISDIA